MKPRLWIAALILIAPLWTAVTAQGQGAKPAPVGRADAPVGTLTVAVATFGNERWLPHLYVGAEDVVLKPMYENLLSRDPKTGELSPMLAERWRVADGGRTWTFYLRTALAQTGPHDPAPAAPSPGTAPPTPSHPSSG